jgi:histidinol-phosphatase
MGDVHAHKRTCGAWERPTVACTLPAVEADIDFALGLADLADGISLPRFRAMDLAVETKPDMTPVSEADRAVEIALRRRIEAERPGEAVIGEEFGRSGAEVTDRWILDPIDGTKNYVRGIPVWGTLIALEREGDLVTAVASAPALGRRWWAVRGGGAHADGLPVHVSGISELADAQLCHGGLRTWRRAGLLGSFLDLSASVWRTRGFGEFWMHMLVAEGAADIAAEMEVRLWDLAAVKLIVEEAGGRFTDLSGRATAEGGSAVSSNGLLHDEVIRMLGARGEGKASRDDG